MPKFNRTTIFNATVKGINCPICEYSYLLRPFDRMVDKIICPNCRNGILLDSETNGKYNGYLFEEK